MRHHYNGVLHRRTQLATLIFTRLNFPTIAANLTLKYYSVTLSPTADIARECDYRNQSCSNKWGKTLADFS